MKKFTSYTTQTLGFMLLAVIVFLSRLPFLFNGYGAEEDAWGLVINALDIRHTGQYVYSRLPGHPVQEVLLAWIPQSPFIYNLFSALFSLVAVLFFARVMKLYGFRHAVWGGFALAFTPVLYISSTYTIDYCWALAFVMMSWYFLLKQRFLLAGTLLGIAVGCRLTSALMFLPFALMLFEHGSAMRWKSIMVFGLSFAAAGFIVYLPAISEYGWDIFSTYKLPYPPLSKVIYKGSIGVWGITGLLALVIAFVSALWKIRKKGNALFTGLPGKIHLVAWLTAIVLTVAIFIRLPEKSAFLIPALPFIILLVARWVKSKIIFAVFCALSIASPFILGVNLSDRFRGAEYSSLAKRAVVSGQEIFIDPLNGPVMNDYHKRRNKEEFTLEVIARMNRLNEPSLVLAGWWHNEIRVRMQENPVQGDVMVMAHADEEMMRMSLAGGRKIYYLPEIDSINDRRYSGQFTRKYSRGLMPE